MENLNQIDNAVRLLNQAAELLSASGQTVTERSEPTPDQSAIQEHRRLFRRTNPTISGRVNQRAPTFFNHALHPQQTSGSGSRSKVRHWQKEIFCLANTDCDIVPNLTDQMLLKANGLGSKKIQFPSLAGPSEVQNILYSAFPKLEAGGGVEYLRVQERSQRKLMVVAAGPIPAEDLRGISTGRCYVRPIQKDLEMDPSKSIGTSAQYSSEKCFKCGNLISISILRQHVQQCQDPEANSESYDNEELPEISLQNRRADEVGGTETESEFRGTRDEVGGTSGEAAGTSGEVTGTGRIGDEGTGTGSTEVIGAGGEVRGTNA